MSKLPAIISTVLPWRRVENRQKRNQFGFDRDVDVYRPRQALDVERGDGGLSRAELKALIKAAELKGAYEQLQRSQDYERASRHADDMRRHEKHLAYMAQREKSARREERKDKRGFIGFLVVAGICALVLILSLSYSNHSVVIIEHPSGYWRAN